MVGKKPKEEVSGVMNRMRQQTKFVLWILVFAFVGTIIFDWGMDFLGVTTPVQQGILGKVNGVEINYQTFDNQMKQEYSRYQQQYGTSPDDRYMRNLREQIWNALVNDILVNEYVEEMGLTATDKEVIQEIRYNPPQELRQAPDFQLEGGGFDQAKYEGFLASDQTGTVIFLENQARQTIPYRKLQQLVVGSVRVTDAEARQRYAIDNTRMDIEYVMAKPDRFNDVEISVTDNEISNYYRANKDDFLVSETRVLRYVLFDAFPTAEDSALVDTRTDEALQRAKAGEDFTELAREYTDSDGFFGTVAKGFASAEYDEVLFKRGTKAGDILGPVKTNNGNSVFIIDRVVKTGSQIDSVEARHMLFSYEASGNTLDNAESKASYFSQTAIDFGLDKAAEDEGLTVLETMPINRSGFIPGFGQNESIFSFAFYSDLEDESKPISSAIETPNGYTVFELSSINETHTRPVDEVRDQITNSIRTEKQLDMTLDLIESVRSDIESGTSLEDAAAKVDLEVKKSESYGFSEYVSDVGRDIRFAGTAYGIDVNDISKAVKGTNGSYIIRVLSKEEINEESFQQQLPTLKQNMLREKQQMAYTNWIMKLRDKADIDDYRNMFFR